MRQPPMRVAGIASHNGTNLRQLHDACHHEQVNAELVLLLSNNGAAPILDFARSNGIAWRHLSSRTHPDHDELDGAVAAELFVHRVDLVFLSGYMKRLGPRTIAALPNRILNVHPALLPRHGGQGMYGDRVYEAVLAAGEREAGPTVHLVDEEYDHGPVVLQHRVPVLDGDTLESLRERVRAAEPGLTIDAVGRVAAGHLDLDSIAARHRGLTPANPTPR